MTKRRPSLAERAALANLAAALGQWVGHDGDAAAALRVLREHGHGLVVRLELTPGPEAPRIQVAGESTVPEWTPNDREILHSLGIASEDGIHSDDRPTQPGGRNSR